MTDTKQESTVQPCRSLYTVECRIGINEIKLGFSFNVYTLLFNMSVFLTTAQPINVKGNAVVLRVQRIPVMSVPQTCVVCCQPDAKFWKFTENALQQKLKPAVCYFLCGEWAKRTKNIYSHCSYQQTYYNMEIMPQHSPKSWRQR